LERFRDLGIGDIAEFNGYYEISLEFCERSTSN